MQKCACMGQWKKKKFLHCWASDSDVMHCLPVARNEKKTAIMTPMITKPVIHTHLLTSKNPLTNKAASNKRIPTTKLVIGQWIPTPSACERSLASLPWTLSTIKSSVRE